MNFWGWTFAFSECDLKFVLDLPYPVLQPSSGRQRHHSQLSFAWFFFVCGGRTFVPSWHCGRDMSCGLLLLVTAQVFAKLSRDVSYPVAPHGWYLLGWGWAAPAQLTVAFCQSPCTLKLPLPSIPCLCDQMFMHLSRNKDGTGIPTQWKR